MGRIILFTLILSLGNAEAKENGFVIKNSRTTYLISIGVNINYESLYCNYCMQDAEAMIERFEADTAADILKLRTILKLNEFNLETYGHWGKSANIKSLANTFSLIASKARSNDLIVIYYAGISMFEFGDDGFTRLENRFYLNKDSSEEGKMEYFTIANLKIWLDGIASQNTIIISDAGPTEEYLSDFLTNLTSIKSDWKGLEQKDRFFIFPEGNGMDNPKSKRGYFSQAITMLPAPYSIADLPNKTFRRYIEHQFFQNAMTLCENKIEINSNRVWFPSVFSEKEFLGKFGSLFSVKESDEPPSRGGDIDEIDEEPPKPKADRKPINRALLIGIDNYENWDPLKNPVFDARSLGMVLQRKFGFDTTILRNPTQEEIIAAIKSLAAEDLSGPADQLFIFFAGHGYLDHLSGLGFLVASDSKSAKNNPSCSSFIQHNFLINILNNLPCPHITFVVDACYSGSIQRDADLNEEDCNLDIPIKWNNLYEGISSVEFINRSMSCPTRRYLTSGGKSYKVPDGHKGKHSPFAQELIEVLEKLDDGEELITFTGVNLKMQQKVNPQPRFGRFGKDAETSEFLFLKTKKP